MKILIVNKFLYPRGGSESYMLGIGKTLKKLGHEVEYFGMYDEKNTVENRLGEYTQNMDFHKKSLERLLYPFRIIYSFESKKKIGKVIDEMQPDVIHLNNINFQLTPSIIDAAKKRHVPVVWTLHDYQLICPGHLLYNNDRNCVCEKCIGRGKSACIKDKCIHSSKIKSILGVIEAKFYKIKGTYKKVDRFIAPSNFLYSKLVADNRPLFENRTTVIHNFVNKKSLPEKVKNNFGFPYIAFAGRLSPEKGTRILKDAARLLPDVDFVVMGGGPDEKMLSGIPNIHLTGFVTGKTLDENIAGAEAVAVPSVCFENCPMAILEGQQLAVPAVTMNMGGMAELVEDGKTGVLSKSVDAESFAAAVKDILSDRKRLAEMKENCLENAKTFSDTDAYCEKLLGIYAEVINNG